MSYSKGSPDWEPDETHGVYSDEGAYCKDGGEEGALYEGEDGELYSEDLYEGDEGDYSYHDDDRYPVDEVLSEDQEPPYTPTPTGTAPKILQSSNSRPPLEKQASVHQQPPTQQNANQISNQTPKPQPNQANQPQANHVPPKPNQTQQSARPPLQQQQSTGPLPSVQSFFAMAKPLTAVFGLGGSSPPSQPSPPTPQPPKPQPQPQSQSPSPYSQPSQTPQPAANAAPQSSPTQPKPTGSPTQVLPEKSQLLVSSAKLPTPTDDTRVTEELSAEDRPPVRDEELSVKGSPLEDKDNAIPPSPPEQKEAESEKDR